MFKHTLQKLFLMDEVICASANVDKLLVAVKQQQAEINHV
jgi:hypothetical protein